MTFSNQTARTSAAGTNTVGQQISYSFPTSADTDLVVMTRTSVGVEATLTLTTDYTATASVTGGIVTLVSALATTSACHIIRDTPNTQSLDLVAGGSFSPENVEGALDKIVKLSIENKDTLDRMIKYPATDPASSIAEMPCNLDRAGKFHFYDGATGASTVTPGGAGTQGFQGTQGVQGVQGARGFQGTQGSIGTQGSTGAQGSAGAAGAQGTQGLTGNQGAQGVAGAQGSQGPQGVTGAQGTQGLTGNQGAQGAAGAQGSQGPQGVTGAQGTQGLTGDQGAQGAAGAQGSAGAQGVAGAQGTQGEQGAVGAQGIDYIGEWGSGPTYDPNDAVGHDGTTYICILQSTNNEPPNATYWNVLSLQGTQGSQGVQGAPGNQGNQGATGVQGATGAQGSQGNVGSQGSVGTQGDQGFDGAQGAPGTQGSQGTVGSQGSIGTQGDQGFDGAQGAPGTQGSQGNVGSQGSTGITGSQGNQGATGAQGAAGAQGEQGSQGNQGLTGVLGDTLATNVAIASGGLLKIGTGTKDVDLTGIQIDSDEIVGQTSGSDDFYIRKDGTALFNQADIIDTAQLVDDAATIHASATTATKTLITSGASGTAVSAPSITTTGGTVKISCSIGQEVYGANTGRITFTIKRGSTVIYTREYNTVSGTYDFDVAFSTTDTPSAGAYVYSVAYSQPGGFSSYIENRKIVVEETKR